MHISTSRNPGGRSILTLIIFPLKWRYISSKGLENLCEPSFQVYFLVSIWSRCLWYIYWKYGKPTKANDERNHFTRKKHAFNSLYIFPRISSSYTLVKYTANCFFSQLEPSINFICFFHIFCRSSIYIWWIGLFIQFIIRLVNSVYQFCPAIQSINSSSLSI